MVIAGPKQRREQYASAIKRITQLEIDNARLRQQRDAANATIDMLMEEMKKAP